MTDHRALVDQCDALIRDVDRDLRANTSHAWEVYGELEAARFAKQQVITSQVKLQELLPNVDPDHIADAINGDKSFDDLLNAN